MRVIAGLGNPGREYQDTRHNAGFMALAAVSRLTRIPVRGFRFHGRTGQGKFKGQELFLLRPRTYMNLSGDSVRACLRSLRLQPADLIVIHDDMDLPMGRLRIKTKGGDGGHRGIRSIISALGTDEFIRVKIGISKPDEDDAEDYVLEPFSAAELPLIEQAVAQAAAAVQALLLEGTAAAMNRFNSAKADP